MSSEPDLLPPARGSGRPRLAAQRLQIALADPYHHDGCDERQQHHPHGRQERGRDPFGQHLASPETAAGVSVTKVKPMPKPERTICRNRPAPVSAEPVTMTVDAVDALVLDVIPAMMMYRSKMCGSEWRDADIAAMIDRVM